ncbi:MAG: insulinase family protein [Deltaproteobacteria bacterium]|nr:insulinase family protein [Deltaproteobacteria bacterium]
MTTTLHTLPNGLNVLLEENRAAPVISFNVLVMVGSAMETEAQAGICHVIEHMLFKGTPTRHVGQIAKDVEAAGGEINAYTSFDQTVYYINMASRFADKGLQILADAVQHPLFDAQELARESEVICEEIRREEDNPSHRVTERLFRQMYGVHPYGRPIIGYAHTVKGFTRDDLIAFWRKWYIPKNMTVIVVGDCDPATMLAKVEAAFGSLPADALPPAPPLALPIEVGGPRATVEQTAIQSSYLSLGLPIPELTHTDVPAIDILAHALAGGESSRLEQALVERKQLAHSIHCYAFTPKGTGLFSIGGVLQTAKLEATMRAIWEEVARVQTHGITVEELARAKLNIRATETYEKETVGGQAGKYALFLGATGDHTFEQRYYAAIQETTVERVREVARRYLTPARTCIMWLAPKEDRGPTSEQLAAVCQPPAAVPAKGKARTERTRPQWLTFPNGLRVIVHENHRLPLVACCAVALGGLRAETRATNGISMLVANALTKGTRHRKALEIAETIDSLAGSIDGFTGRNSLGVRGEFLAEKFAEGFALFAEVISEPAFPADEVAKEKRQLIEAIRNQEDNLPAIAMLHFTRALYGRHPYGLRQLGERDAVRSLTPIGLKRFYHRLTHPRHMVLGIAGDVDAASVRRLVMKHLPWKGGRPPSFPRLPHPGVTEPITVELKRADKQQAHIVFGFLGTTLGSPDQYRLTVLNYILSGQGGRLFTKLRDQQSLAYSVYSSHQAGIDPGLFTVYIGTEPGKVQTALDGIKRELKSLADNLVDEGEYERARQYLVGAFELDRQRNASMAGSYAFNVLYGLGLREVERYPEKILKVTREDVLRVARKYLRLDRAVCSIIWPE